MSVRFAVGVLGCGEVARGFHLPVLRRLRGVDVVGIADPDPARRAAVVAWMPGVTAHAEARSLLEQSGLDAVVVSSPPALHASHAMAAFERGLHVYLEKPLAIGEDEGARVMAAWRAAATVGRMGFNYRFAPHYVRARRALANGAIGDPIEAHTVFSIGATSIPVWKRARATGGGALLDLGSHHIDLARFLFRREVRSVRAEITSRQSEDDTAALDLELDGGIAVRSYLSLRGALEERFEVIGSEGALLVDRLRHRDVVIRRANGRPAARARYALGSARYLMAQVRAPGREPSFRASLAGFVADARRGGATTPDLEDGMRSLEVVLAAEIAARNGAREVRR